MTRDELEAIVRLELRAALAAPGRAPSAPSAPRAAIAAPAGAAAAATAAREAGPPDGGPATDDRGPEPLELVNVSAVRSASGAIRVAPGGVVTPLARDEAEKRGIALIEVERGAREERPPVGSAALGRPARAANPRRVAIACDHGGLALKRELVNFLRAQGYELLDLGTHDEGSVDYPDLAHALARAVADGEAARGVVIDGAGIGSAMVANKVPGVRAAHCHNLFETRNSREHNDANVLSLGGRVIGGELAKAMVALWLETPFGGGRHGRRVDKIKAVEASYLR